ncbi:MAG: amidase domain-containing protein [Clostridia bacterium]|nr:amidase domain-containing protein [Clostridia bacterium]
MYIDKYNRQKAIEYAKKWAFKRNPNYYNFDSIGGDCTNFISQCLYEGSKTMNYTNTYGWYYKSANDKSPSWTGVQFLYNFLINNKGLGPIANVSNQTDVQIGDIIQLSFDNTTFSHSLIIVEKENNKTLVASHTFDTYGRNINSYSYKKIRFIHILGVQKD